MNNKSIWKKIKEFFKNLFNLKNQKLLVKNNEIEDKERRNVNIKTSKEEFFDIYNKVKNKKIKLDSLSIEDLEKIDKMLDEEIRIKTNKVDVQITELNMKKMNIKFYKQKLNEINN